VIIDDKTKIMMNIQTKDDEEERNLFEGTMKLVSSRQQQRQNDFALHCCPEENLQNRLSDGLTLGTATYFWGLSKVNS
jgi:hypothetical protein